MNKNFFIVSVISVFLPTAISISMGGLRLTVYRIFMILMLLIYASKAFRSLKKNLLAPQILMLMYSFWVFLSLSVSHGVGRSIETAGIHFVETIAPFYLIVLYATDIKKCIYAIKIILFLVVGMLAITIPESIFGFNWFKTEIKVKPTP